MVIYAPIRSRLTVFCFVFCRGLTRKTDSEKAEALRSKGVEVVAANLDDKASLVSAFTGADGIFVLTNFWEVFE
jgi:hypothetical protein